MRSSLLIAAGVAATCRRLVRWRARHPARAGASRTPTCGDDGGFDDDGGVLTPCAWDQPVTRPDDTTAQMQRAACAYNRGDMPAATLGPGTPIDTDIPIDNIVVVVMENHSFDSYLGHLNQYANRTDIESADAGATNPGVDGGPVPWAHAPHPCSLDTNHEWLGTHLEIDDGKMDGFVKVNDGYNKSAASARAPIRPSGAGPAPWGGTTRPICRFTTSWPARSRSRTTTTARCPGRRTRTACTSSPGRASAGPRTCSRTSPTTPGPATPRACSTSSRSGTSRGSPTRTGRRARASSTARPGRRAGGTPSSAASPSSSRTPRAGTLPAGLVRRSRTSASETNGGAGTDEHPPGDIQSGQLFVSQVVQSVMSGPQWAHTAILVTHDENGGFYDHVAPPKACPPDHAAPKLPAGRHHPGRLRRVRHPRAAHRRQPVCQAGLRGPPGLRPHQHHAVHRGQVQDPGPHRAGRQRDAADRPLRLRRSTRVPHAADDRHAADRPDRVRLLRRRRSP